jgi:hypothetical protein
MHHSCLASYFFFEFSLVYNSCTGGLVVIFPYMCTMYPSLVLNTYFIQCHTTWINDHSYSSMFFRSKATPISTLLKLISHNERPVFL